jgi:hypothetical protein
MTKHRNHNHKNHHHHESPKPPPCPIVISESNITPQPITMTVNFDNLTTNYVNATISPLNILGNNPPINPIVCWCGQYNVTIPVNVPFNTVLVSSYDIKLLSVLSFYDVAMIQYNMRKVNWVVNRLKYYQSSPLNYTYGDIQTAIWRLLDNPSYTPSIPYTLNNVNNIINDANTGGINYIPTQQDEYCIILCIPLTPSGLLLANPYQVMLLPVQLKNLKNSIVNTGLPTIF